MEAEAVAGVLDGGGLGVAAGDDAEGFLEAKSTSSISFEHYVCSPLR